MLKPGDTILNGKYRIVEPLGKGAFAHVYRAHHQALNRDVAVKVLQRGEPGVGSTRLEAYRERFRLEAELGAQFDDPHLVKVYDFEEEDGSLYLVMEYCPGGSLQKWLEEKGPLAVDEAVQMAREVGMGLALLHRHRPQVVHRDLKPSNILLGADGVWKVADLGLSQVPLRTSRRSALGSAADRHPGTPEYMSPEQEETVGYLQPPSDVWALGAVVFEALTGRLYKGERPGVRVREVRPEVPEWLDELVARLLAEDKRARPWDGGEVVQAIEEALAGAEKATAEGKARQAREEQVREFVTEASPVQRDETAARQLVGQVAGLPTWVMLVGIGVLMVAVALGLRWGRGQGRPTPAPTVARVAVETSVTLLPKRTDTARPLTAGAPSVPIPTSTAALAPAKTPVPLTATQSPTGTSNNTSQSVATPGVQLGKEVITWENASKVTELASIEAGAAIRKIAWSPDGGLLAVATSSGLHAYNVPGLDAFAPLRIGGNILDSAFSPDGTQLATVTQLTSRGADVQLWRVSDGALLYTLKGHEGKSLRIAFSPDGTIIAGSSSNTKVYLWRVSDGELLRVLEDPAGASNMLSVAFSPDGETLASGSLDGSIRLWRVSDGVVLRKFEDCNGGDIAFSRDGTLLAASCGVSGSVWSLPNGLLLGEWGGYIPRALSLSRDGTVVAAGLGGGKVELWRLPNRVLLCTLSHYPSSYVDVEVTSVAFSPDGRTLASGSSDGNGVVRLWGVR